jgi:hypothetical protein
MKTTFKPAINALLTALLLMPLAALHAADATTPGSKASARANPGVTLESRGLPLTLFNNDSDDLKWPAYPEHHTQGLWVPVGKYSPLPKITSLDDYLGQRIGALAKTTTQGLSYCGNLGMSVWDLKRDHIAALGNDPLQPILQFWKQGGRKFLFSLRMNDLHHAWVPPSPHSWNEFRRTHRDLWFKPPTEAEWETQFLPWLNGTGPKPVFAKDSDLLLDYSKPQVREHYLDVVREACRRYDLDGIELDWLCYGEMFRQGEVDAATITAFVSEARSILDESAKRRGRPLRLVARVSDSPVTARSRGMDVEAWLKKGLLDAVIAGAGMTYSANKLEEWVALAHRYQTPVYGVMERLYVPKSSFSRFGTPETLRAAAATIWGKGADGLYFFNFYLRDEMPLLDELSDRSRLAQLSKEYFVDAYFGGSHSNGPLPLTLNSGTPAAVHLVIADDPAEAKATSLEIVFKTEGELDTPEITLNGRPLREFKSTRGKANITFTLNSAALKEALKRGANEFSFTSAASASLTSLSVRVEP